ncbi:hypothetical protein C8Q78DRAFT_181482 [Trametes maxima]|nr:hypothetical protein C8Q78DRAFT_181482 [Trametes maxima]
MSEIGFNVWGVVASVIGTVALIPPLAMWIIHCLPTAKLRVVDKLLKETEREFHAALADGLIRREVDLHRFHNWLWSLQLRVEDMRVEVYNVHSWQNELGLWWKGLSSDMSVICKEMAKFRAKLAGDSSRERRAMAAAGFAAKLASSWSGLRDRLPYATVTPISRTTPLAPTMLQLHNIASPVDVDAVSTAGVMSSTPGFATLALDAATPPSYSTCNPAVALPSKYSACSMQSTRMVPPPETPSRSGEHHSVSDADLKHLLVLALSSPSHGQGEKHQRASRNDVLLRFGRQLFGPDAPGSFDVALKRHTKRSRVGAVRRLMKRTYEVRSQDTSARTMHPPQESLISQQSGNPNDHDGDGWHDVDE